MQLTFPNPQMNTQPKHHQVTASVAEIQRRLGMLALSPPKAPQQTSIGSPPSSSVVVTSTTHPPPPHSAGGGHHNRSTNSSSYTFGGVGGNNTGYSGNNTGYRSSPTTVRTVVTTTTAGGLHNNNDDGAGSDNGSDVQDAREQWSRRHHLSYDRTNNSNEAQTPALTHHLYPRARAGLSPTTPRP